VSTSHVAETTYLWLFALQWESNDEKRTTLKLPELDREPTGNNAYFSLMTKTTSVQLFRGSKSKDQDVDARRRTREPRCHETRALPGCALQDGSNVKGKIGILKCRENYVDLQCTKTTDPTSLTSLTWECWPLKRQTHVDFCTTWITKRKTWFGLA